MNIYVQVESKTVFTSLAYIFAPYKNTLLMVLTINRYQIAGKRAEDIFQLCKNQWDEMKNRRGREWEMAEKEIGRSIMKPNLLLLSLRFKGNKVTTSCWCGSRKSFLKSRDEDGKIATAKRVISYRFRIENWVKRNKVDTRQENFSIIFYFVLFMAEFP
jgi:hypothetical protein